MRFLLIRLSLLAAVVTLCSCASQPLGQKAGGTSGLIGGEARWEVGPFSAASGWLDAFPELQGNSAEYSQLMTGLIRQNLRMRLIDASASNEPLSAERLQQLIDEDIQYLIDGTLKKLEPDSNGPQLELQLVYRLRRLVGGQKFRLVHIRPLTAAVDSANKPTDQAVYRLLNIAAEQVVDALLREIPADVNASRG